MRVPPITPVRKVETQLESPLPAGHRKLGDQVPSAIRCLDAVEGRRLRVPQAEGLVVTSGEIHVAHARVDRQLRDGVGIESFSGKAVGEFGVLGHGDLLGQLHPLVTPEQRIQPVVDEKSVAGFPKSLASEAEGRWGDWFGDGVRHNFVIPVRFRHSAISCSSRASRFACCGSAARFSVSHGSRVTSKSCRLPTSSAPVAGSK